MCLVSHKHKFIYIKTFKTASSSLYRLFSAYCCPPLESGDLDMAWGLHEPRTADEPLVSDYGVIGAKNKGQQIENWGAHIPLVAVKRELGEKIFNSYFKFTSVRHPAEQAVSAFYHNYHNYRNYRNLENNSDSELVSRKFHHYLKNQYDPDENWNQYTINNVPACDDYIRFEDLSNETNRILQILNLEPNLRIPQLRKGDPPKCQSKSLYKDANRKLYETMFEKELNFFNYTLSQYL